MYFSNCHGDPSHFFGGGIVNERWGHTCTTNIWITQVESEVSFSTKEVFCFYFKLNLVMILSNINEAVLHGFCCLLEFSFCFVNTVSFIIKIFSEGLRKCEEMENISKETKGKLFMKVSLERPFNSCPHFLQSQVCICLLLCPPQIFTIYKYL